MRTRIARVLGREAGNYPAKPGRAGIHASAYMNVWYLRSSLPAEEDQAIAGVDSVFAGLKQLAAWESRMRALGHGRREEMSADDALAIATKASPETVAENDPDDPNGRKVGDKVRVVPGRLWQGRSWRRDRISLGAAHRDTPRRRTHRRDRRPFPARGFSRPGGLKHSFALPRTVGRG